MKTFNRGLNSQLGKQKPLMDNINVLTHAGLVVFM